MTRVYPRIASVMALVGVTLLLSLLLAFWYFGLAQTNLVQQTERELNTQAAFVAAMYRHAYAKAEGFDVNQPLRVTESEVEWQPLSSGLTFDGDSMLDEQPIPQSVAVTLDPVEQSAGASLVRILQDAQSKTLASIRVVNAAGIVVSSTNLVDHVSLFDRVEVQRALAGKHTAVLRKRRLTHDDPSAYSISRRANFRVHVAHPIYWDQQLIGAVVLSRTPESLWQLLGRHKIRVGIILVAILAVTWMLMVFTSHTITQPILALMEQAKRAQRGEKGAVMPLANPVTFEINQLSLSVADMARTLEARADFLMEYASHISHEFKSPVTSLQGAIELLADHGDEMEDVERNRFFANMSADVHRLNNLVIRLLDFARADLNRFGLGTCWLQPQLQTLQQYYASNPITIQWQIPSMSDTQVNLSDDALQSILRNLLDNAIAAHGQNIIVKVTEYVDGVQLEVIDDGEALSIANRQKIFEPFFTLHRKVGGTGLGLSIVQALLRHAGGSISLQVEDQFKYFTVRVPKL